MNKDGLKLGCNSGYIYPANWQLAWEWVWILVRVIHCSEWLDSINNMSKEHKTEDRFRCWFHRNATIPDSYLNAHHISALVLSCQAVTISPIISMGPSFVTQTLVFWAKDSTESKNLTVTWPGSLLQKMIRHSFVLITAFPCITEGVLFDFPSDQESLSTESLNMPSRQESRQPKSRWVNLFFNVFITLNPLKAHNSASHNWNE